MYENKVKGLLVTFSLMQINYTENFVDWNLLLLAGISKGCDKIEFLGSRIEFLG